MSRPSAFDRLHPALRHHVVNSLGWTSLRPLQEAAVGPVLDGDHVLLLAPTAGGKTEAAVFPLLSRMLGGGWRGLSVLYVCPIKALLNDLEPRLRACADPLGRRVDRWHGDVGAARRRRIVREPPDLLLTTPESIEVLLVSNRTEPRVLFRDLQAVVVDELHAFAGDDRGWHLLAVLERVGRLADREVQRLGLSATIGNPEALLDWLAPASSRPRRVVAPEGGTSASAALPAGETPRSSAGETPAGAPAALPVGGSSRSPPEPSVHLDYVGSLRNAARVVAALHRGEKRLVFCDSRGRVEALAAALREAGTETFVSHGSLGLDERRRSEEAFAQGRDCVIVATSTLELGLDVGDLDRVIQIDAPPTVAAFLQRLGRTGRRAGAARNCLFLATADDGFLRAAGLLRLWRAGYVEPVVPPPEPFHVFAQQILALVLQEGRIGRSTWREWLGGMPAFRAMEGARLDDVLEFMLARGILHEEAGMLAMGPEGERVFGRRHFLDLLSVFTGEPLFAVRHGRTELGLVHPLSFQVRRAGPVVLLLAGRGWEVSHVDRARRVAYVRATTRERGRSCWIGTGVPLGFALCRAIRRVLADGAPDVELSRRARGRLAEIRGDFDWVDAAGTAVVRDAAGASRWWTFAGLRANTSLGEALGPLRRQGAREENLSIRLRDGAGADDVRRRLDDEGAAAARVFPVTDAAVESLKFSACLPPGLAGRTLRARGTDAEAVGACLREPVRHVVLT